MELNRKYSKHVLELRENDQIPYLVFPLLEDTNMVIQGFSTRIGGVSPGYLGEMNFSYGQGDAKENVKENLRRFVSAIGGDPERIVMSMQTHTTNVRTVTEADLGRGYSKERCFEDVDGLITNVPGAVLVTTYADCVPLYFVDPVHRAIGLSHSGWRGTVNHMGKATLQAMKQAYGTNPKEVYAAIGPSICQNCYEVSGDVIDCFRENFPSSLHQELFYKKDNGKFQLNLWKANEAVLTLAGVKKEHLQVTDICTCCNSKYLHSHRASHGKRGALAAFLAIRAADATE